MMIADDFSHDLDFWLGTWKGTVQVLRDAEKREYDKTTCTNKISLSFDGKVVLEEFKMGTFSGSSWSVPNAKQKIWQQTWVDSSGSYFHLEGSKIKEGFELHCHPNKSLPEVKYRMRFTSIKKDSFNWTWEFTKNGGKDWLLQMGIDYTRVSSR